jgi:hypothetical protein
LHGLQWHCADVMPTWRYEFIVTDQTHSPLIVLDGGDFVVDNIHAARRVVASVMRNIKVSGPTQPTAIRLLDPKGEEVWRALL